MLDLLDHWYANKMLNFVNFFFKKNLLNLKRTMAIQDLMILLIMAEITTIDIEETMVATLPATITLCLAPITILFLLALIYMTLTD